MKDPVLLLLDVSESVSLSVINFLKKNSWLNLYNFLDAVCGAMVTNKWGSQSVKENVFPQF